MNWKPLPGIGGRYAALGGHIQSLFSLQKEGGRWGLGHESHWGTGCTLLLMVSKLRRWAVLCLARGGFV